MVSLLTGIVRPLRDGRCSRPPLTATTPRAILPDFGAVVQHQGTTSSEYCGAYLYEHGFGEVVSRCQDRPTFDATRRSILDVCRPHEGKADAAVTVAVAVAVP